MIYPYEELALAQGTVDLLTTDNYHLRHNVAKLKIDNETLRSLIRKLEVNDKASCSVVRLQRVEIARNNVRINKEKAEAAARASDYWKLRELIAGWESRTGKKHSTLLMGDYNNTYGEQE